VGADFLVQRTDNNTTFHPMKQLVFQRAFLIAYRLCEPVSFHRLCVVKISKTSIHQNNTHVADEITQDIKHDQRVTMQVKPCEEENKVLPLVTPSVDWKTLGNSDVLEQLKLLDEKSTVILKNTDGVKKNLSK
jgi:hypothetical protein